MLPTPPDRPYLCGSEKQEVGSMPPISLIDTTRKKCLGVSAYSFLCVLADTMFNISDSVASPRGTDACLTAATQIFASERKGVSSSASGSLRVLMWTPRDKGLARYSYLPIPSPGLMWKAKLDPRVCDIPTLGFWMMSFSADIGGHGLSFCRI